jgi:putative nucleotidyltransferase with HDIG domain
MTKNYLKKNLYDKHGTLLLSKGQELSESMIRKLEAKDYKQIREMIAKDEDLQHGRDIRSNSQCIQKKFKIDNEPIINSSSKIVTDILFESKDQPWWLYVNTLSNYVDWLYTHSVQVSVFSVMIADALNIKELKEIALGSFLHDIGKLMIPKNIIDKPKKLTDEEFFYIRQHCDLGISMVKEFNLPQISLDIIQQHHERLDGSGYPQGLKDQQIPIHSRIVMIADILDAITSYRPYKSLRQIESAIDELKADATKYPQEILEVFSTFFKAG